jgi:hypothetical protein
LLGTLLAQESTQTGRSTISCRQAATSHDYHMNLTILSQAQYFRDHRNLHQYFVANTFLAPLNNEVAPELQNSTYKENFLSLENLVLVMFSNDQTVVPKESAWFGSYSTPTDSSSRKEPEIVPMRVRVFSYLLKIPEIMGCSRHNPCISMTHLASSLSTRLDVYTWKFARVLTCRYLAIVGSL